MTQHATMLDERDRKILNLLQANADVPLAEVAVLVNLSTSACSRRIAWLKEEGYIARQVAVLDRRRVNMPTTVFVIVKASHHSAKWLDDFRAAVGAIPEIMEVHRLTGNFDYILKIALPNVEHYDAIYKALMQRIELSDVSAYISMETLKFETVVPTSYA